MQGGIRHRDRLLDGTLPVSTRRVATQRDTASAPCAFVEPANFNNQVALFLARLNQLRPICYRLTANKRRVEHGIRRQFDWIHDPGLWNDFSQ